MAEQSHHDEMNAAIRAQRERSAVPKTIAPELPAKPETAPPPPGATPQSDASRRLFRRRRRGTPPA
jgi:hypothetical protein